MRLQEQANTQNAAADAQRMFNMQKFLGTGLAQNQTAFDYINSMNMMGLDAYGRAQDASTIGTQMDIGKTSAMLGILGSQPTGGGWGQIVSGAGQGISDVMNAYQMSQFFEGFGGGGNSINSPSPFFNPINPGGFQNVNDLNFQNSIFNTNPSNATSVLETYGFPER